MIGRMEPECKKIGQEKQKENLSLIKWKKLQNPAVNEKTQGRKGNERNPVKDSVSNQGERNGQNKSR